MVSFFQAGCLLVILSSVLISSAYSDQSHVRHKRAALVPLACSAGQTKVHTGYLYDTTKQCAQLIGEVPDYYRLKYRQECQRWLNLPAVPSRVGDARLPTGECFQFSNGTARYRAQVCCESQTTAQRCFTCPTQRINFDMLTSKYTTLACDHLGPVVTCGAGEICQTQFSSKYTPTKNLYYYMSKSCVAMSTCNASESNNTNSCVSNKLKNPKCTYCCTGPFCNYNNRVVVRSPLRDCVCYYGGTCVPDSTDSRGYRCVCKAPYYGKSCSYHPCSKIPCKNRGYCYRLGSDPYYKCYCRPGWIGQNCTIAAKHCYPDNPCLNGGTCYEHDYGWRCVCASGFVGTTCQYKRPITCKTAGQHVTYAGEYRWSTSKHNCSDAIDKYEAWKHMYSMKSRCRTHMGGSGLHPQVYKDTDLVTNTLSTCERGNGMIWFKFESCCPACFSDPCQNDGLCLSTEGGNDYVCACQFGYEGKNCENRVSMCFASGDPHYKTFDGEMIHFQGDCKYTMVSPKSTITGVPDFRVYVKNEHRKGNTHVSYTKYVEMHLNGKVIRIGRDKITTVDGVRVYPDVAFTGFRIVNNGFFVRLETDFGLAIESDGRWLTVVKVPASFASKVEGLCANFDSNRLNDFTLSNGTDVSMDPYKHSLVGISWHVDDAENPSCTSTIDPPPPECDAEKTKLFSGNSYCGLIKDKTGVFRSCLSDSGIWSLAPSYYENCMFDTCANQDNLTDAKEAACGSLQVLAADCASKGKMVNWRVEAGCPLTCPDGSNMVYKVRTSACIPTCANPTADKACGLPDTESCTCDTGMLLWKGECVKPEECGCHHSNQYYSIGDTWLSYDCLVRFSCVACKSCAYPVGQVVNTTYSCADNEDCIIVNSTFGCYKKFTPVDGSWGAWGSWSDCVGESCIGGKEIRSRLCNSPAPQNGGKPCPDDDDDDEESRACDCIDGGWSEWSDWTSCRGLCNAWTHERQRWCDNPEPQGVVGTDCVGDSSESQPCECTLPFNATVECGRCEVIVNGLAYFPDLCDCHSYYQCEQINGVWHGHHRNCSICTLWNQEDLTCGIRIPDCEDGEDTTESVPVIANDTCIKDGQIKKEHDTDNQKYIWVVGTQTYDMPCPEGTSFNFDLCLCDHDDTVVIRTPTAVMCVPFGEGWNGFAANPGWGYVGVYGVSIIEKTSSNKCAIFSGAGHLEIPRFQNYVPKHGFSVSFWFKRTGADHGEQGLISNNCAGKCSIEITSASQTTLYAKVKTVDEDGSTYYGSVTAIPVSHDTWHHVVYSYDGEYLSVYVDKVNHVSAYTPGKIFNTQCAMIVGLKANYHYTNYFTGYMDQLCFNDGPVSATRVGMLYRELAGDVEDKELY